MIQTNNVLSYIAITIVNLLNDALYLYTDANLTTTKLSGVL